MDLSNLSLEMFTTILKLLDPVAVFSIRDQATTSISFKIEDKYLQKKCYLFEIKDLS